MNEQTIESMIATNALCLGREIIETVRSGNLELLNAEALQLLRDVSFLDNDNKVYHKVQRILECVEE